MKKAAYSLPAKLACGLVFIVSTLLAAGAVILVCGAYDTGFYQFPTGWSYIDALERLYEDGWLGEYMYSHMSGSERGLFEFVFVNRYSAIVIASVCALVSVALFILLMCASGRKNGSEGVSLNYFDRLPFDLILAVAAALEVVLMVFVSDLSYNLGRADTFFFILMMALVVAAALLLFLLVCCSFAARVKAGKWWRNTLIFMVCHLLCVWVRAVFRWAVRLFRAIRFEWRVALATAAAWFLDFIALTYVAINESSTGFLIYLLVWAAVFTILVFGANQLRKLRVAGGKLAAGELDYKVNTEKMYFDFRLMGEDLNSIGEGMSAAVEQKMKSERLKTELITNVSHDIKTPLTSIINYVDLLQKEHTPEEETQYLDVLKRQSDKLRRLTLDLVEASKASTGNLTTELVPTNTDELINQAVAEYADRFAQGHLEPVITLPEKTITVLADGRHLWRVLDNLFSNTVKYAQPGTRVYIDARRLDGEAVISVKNISRDRLNVSADELMERFVRGDESRHTEGSGLGLSIARSLTELMGGRFDISIDGDLFKAEIRLKLL